MTPHQRFMVRALRRDYGVVDARLGRGGKHPFVEFTKDGRRHRMTVTNASSDPVAVENWTRQALYARLGSPKTTPERTKRRLEEMMPESFNPLPAAKAVSCSVALYGNGNSARLRFNVPIAASLAGWAGVGVKILGADAWELRNDSSAKRRWVRGDRTHSLKIDISDPAIAVGDPFGSSPAEIVEVDGRLLVTCPVATRVPMRLLKAKGGSEITFQKSIQRMVETVLQNDQSPHDRRLAVLREIAAIETETDRRLALVVLDGRRVWEWRVPPERLEE